MSKLSNIKDLIFERRLFRQRLIAAIVMIVVFTSILVLRLAYLQILQHKRYATLSKHNYLELLPVEPNRGLIYDRNGILLAEDVPVFSLDIVPDHVENLAATIIGLQQIVAISPNDLNQFYKSLKRQSGYDPIPLKIKLTDAEVASFCVNQYKFPGVMIDARMIRNYPLGESMVSVLGYVGRINAWELASLDSVNYSASNFIGKTGIEKYYELQLHGKVGYKQVEIDASGRPVRVVKYIPPIRGDTLYLTIDSKLQAVAMKALGKEQGAMVAIQPDTGEILALVSNPGFDPNLFVKGISAKEFKKLQTSSDMPMYNRAIRGQFSIASTIKPFLALEGLDLGAITPKDRIYDPGWFRLANTSHIYRNWKRGGNGWINVTSAIIVSCDTFFYNLAVKLGIFNVDDILNRFGFGRKTGIDMEGELSGLIPSPSWKMHARGKPWYTGDTVNFGIGQGYMLATPLQLVVATAALADRGLRFKPYILMREQNTDGQIVTQQPIAEDPVMIRDKKAWGVVIKAMQGVVRNVYGTARIRFGTHPKYTVAAKTGTSQVYSKRDENAVGDYNIPKYLRNHSLFIAFAPVKHPRIAIAVVVEHSPIAGTVARKVLDYYLLKEKQKT